MELTDFSGLYFPLLIFGGIGGQLVFYHKYTVLSANTVSDMPVGFTLLHTLTAGLILTY